MVILTTQNGQIMESEEFNDEGTFTVNYNMVAKNKDVLTVTRLLATSLMINPYMAPGDFFKNMSDADLQMLQSIDNEEHEDFGNFMLLSEMLATAEGLDHGDLDAITMRMNQFLMFLSMEGLYRKNMIKLYHENISFGDDVGDKIVAEKV